MGTKYLKYIGWTSTGHFNHLIKKSKLGGFINNGQQSKTTIRKESNALSKEKQNNMMYEV